MTKTITKRDIINEVAKMANLSQQQTDKIVNQVFHTMVDFLIHANPSVRIEIRNFGVFEVKPTKAKPKARNPRTNEIIYVPAHRKTRFKPGKAIRDELRKPLK
ncbi:MAG: integration host factor subunit beta [Candidatus Marinimicrobia bacterium]|nr:integration host factor subunit beta [Candidatus Neomarinimicrobiota bacterium]